MLVVLGAMFVAVQATWPLVPGKAGRLLAALLRIACVAQTELIADRRYTYMHNRARAHTHIHTHTHTPQG